MAITVEALVDRESVCEIASHSLFSTANHYLHLRIGIEEVRCPYYMNNDALYQGTPYYRAVRLGGKRTPHEIEAFANERAAERNFNIGTASSQDIRDFLFEIGAGVDCSGFVYNLSKLAFEEVSGVPIECFVKKPTDPSISGVTRISSKDLVHPLNSSSIKNLRDIKPADIISIAGGRHVISILSVSQQEIMCAHCTNVIPAWGPNIFSIRVLNPEGSIFEQDWREQDWTGIPYVESLRRLNYLKEEDGIKRLHAFEILYKATSEEANMIGQALTIGR